MLMTINPIFRCHYRKLLLRVDFSRAIDNMDFGSLEKLALNSVYSKKIIIECLLYYCKRQDKKNIIKVIAKE